MLANTQHNDARTDRSLAEKLQNLETATLEDLRLAWIKLFGREPAACMPVRSAASRSIEGTSSTKILGRRLRRFTAGFEIITCRLNDGGRSK